MRQFLKDVGFTEYESKVYLVLAQLGTGIASEISMKSNVPSNKVYECLIKLAERGFVGSLDVTPRQYTITGIRKFQDIIEAKENSLTTMKQKIQELKTTITTQQLHTQEIAMALRGKTKLVQMLQEITQKSVDFHYTFGGSLRFDHTGARFIRDAIKRGVEFQFLVHYDEKRKDVYKKWRDVGVKIRFYPKDEQKSIRFSSFDGKAGRITIGEPQMELENYLTFWIESPALAEMLKDQFLGMWEKGNPFHTHDS
jgi:sugar-specific transcriptional regulator TrmB